jgi:hypothetical protein
MSVISIETIKISTTGSAGSAQGHASTIPINGFLLDVYLNYHASCPATADVTISDPVFGNILVNSNSATDVRLAPREPTCDASAASTGLYDLIPINSALTVTIEAADALTDCLVATIRWLDA